MVEKGEVFLDLNVTEVMPITHLWRIELVQQRWQFTFAWNFFITTAAFDSEFHFFRRRVSMIRFRPSFTSSRCPADASSRFSTARILFRTFFAGNSSAFSAR